MKAIEQSFRYTILQIDRMLMYYRHFVEIKCWWWCIDRVGYTMGQGQLSQASALPPMWQEHCLTNSVAFCDLQNVFLVGPPPRNPLGSSWRSPNPLVGWGVDTPPHLPPSSLITRHLWRLYLWAVFLKYFSLERRTLIIHPHIFRWNGGPAVDRNCGNSHYREQFEQRRWRG